MSTLQEIDAVTKSLRERCNRQAQTLATMKVERDELKERARRHEGWLTIADGTDDARTALAAFMEWRGNGYTGDPLDFLRAAAGESADELERPSAQLGLDDGWRNGSRDDDDPLWTDCDCGTCSKALDEGVSAIQNAAPPSANSPVADGPIATRFETAMLGTVEMVTQGNARVQAPLTVSDHLHAAQLAARQHVVPHIVRAAELARAEGKIDEFQTFMGIAAVIDGALDPMILRYGEAFLRFVRGSE